MERPLLWNPPRALTATQPPQYQGILSDTSWQGPTIQSLLPFLPIAHFSPFFFFRFPSLGLFYWQQVQRVAYTSHPLIVYTQVYIYKYIYCIYKSNFKSLFLSKQSETKKNPASQLLHEGCDITSAHSYLFHHQSFPVLNIYSPKHHFPNRAPHKASPMI